MDNTTPYSEVRKTAAEGDYKCIPISRTLLSDIRTPVNVLRALMNVSGHCFLLESAEDSRQRGRWTFLGFDPSMTLTCRDHTLTIKAGGTVSVKTDRPGGAIRQIIRENRSPKLPGYPPFTGGLVGYFAYDYIKYGEPVLDVPYEDDPGYKDMDLMLFDKLIAFDNYRQKIVLIANVRTDEPESGYNKAVMQLDNMENLIRHGTPKAAEPGRLLAPLKPKFSREEYGRKVEQVKEHIREGDIFQLVLSNPLEAPYEGSLLNAFRVLRTTNPSPYMFYFSGDELEIAGASPETLVKVEDRVIHTFPLAGSRPRGAADEEDRRLERELLADEKERAEHNMLVDLGRNDLGRLCSFGTVTVDRYMEVQRYSHIMHIGSSVKGQLREDVAAADAVDAVLPAGTLSGAPKIRACQLIHELEGDRRGLYGGAVGYVDFTGNLDVCIAIRLAFKHDGVVTVRSGAGIVADSVPDREYEECMNKAKAVVQALEEAEAAE